MKSVSEPEGSSVPEPSPDTAIPRAATPDLSLAREELERILSSRHFQTSKRCQSFLRYVVEQILSGRHDLKERSIGVEVFERSPTYDTNLDPVVRMTAGEVRKRLALYYQDAGKNSELRVELPVGSYVPHLHWASGNRLQLGPAAETALSALPKLPDRLPDPPADTPVFLPPATPAIRPRRMLKVLVLSLASVLLLLCAGIARWAVFRPDMPPQPTPIDQFWEPVLASASSTLISIGQIRPMRAEVQPNNLRSAIRRPMELADKEGFPRQIAVAVLKDAIVMANVAALLRSHGKQFNIRAESATSFADLQRGPSVLIGAFNNDWTIMFTRPLRFYFDVDESKSATWISDREHPGSKFGYIDSRNIDLDIKEDYAIVVRMVDTRTKEIVVIAAGITPYGTQSAGEFATDPAMIAELARRAPPDWSHKNMEILIKTDLIDGETGAPQIVASTFW